MGYLESLDEEKRRLLTAKSYDEVCDLLEKEDPDMEEAVEALLDEYASLCGDALANGKDYLPVLEGIVIDCDIQQVAVEMLEEAFDEEFGE